MINKTRQGASIAKAIILLGFFCVLGAGDVSACPSLRQKASRTPDASLASTSEFVLLEISFYYRIEYPHLVAKETQEVYRILEGLCSRQGIQARLLFESRSGGDKRGAFRASPVRVHQFISVPSSSSAEILENALLREGFREITGRDSSSKEFEGAWPAFRRIEQEPLGLRFILGSKSNDPSLQLEVSPWEFVDPAKTETLRSPFCRVEDMMTWLCQQPGVECPKFKKNEPKRFGIQICLEEDGEYHAVRLSVENITGKAPGCDRIRIED